MYFFSFFAVSILSLCLFTFGRYFIFIFYFVYMYIYKYLHICIKIYTQYLRQEKKGSLSFCLRRDYYHFKASFVSIFSHFYSNSSAFLLVLIKVHLSVCWLLATACCYFLFFEVSHI